MSSGSVPLSLADKINRLFALHSRGGRPPSNEEVAAAINALDGSTTISASYLWLLRTGNRDNPTIRHLQALARHFSVSPVYFFDPVAADRIENEIELIRAARDAGVKRLALTAVGLPPEALTALTVIAEQARTLHGLGEVPTRAGGDRPGDTAQEPPHAREQSGYLGVSRVEDCPWASPSVGDM